MHLDGKEHAVGSQQIQMGCLRCQQRVVPNAINANHQ